MIFTPPQTFVIVWRETTSPHARLRTYADPSTDRPLAYALEDISPAPAPTTILTTPTQVEAYLLSSTTVPHAIDSISAQAVLGWDPLPTTPSPSPSPSPSPTSHSPHVSTAPPPTPHSPSPSPSPAP